MHALLRGLAHTRVGRCGWPHRGSSVRRMAHTYDYPRPALTVDALIVASPGPDRPQAQVLLIKRKKEPYQGRWALPGGFVDENEPLDAAASRELEEETSVHPSRAFLTQVGMFGDPGRDPRGWVVSAAYAAVVPTTELGVKAADDAQDAQWFPISDLPPLAFDHQMIVRTALRVLCEKPKVADDAELVLQLQEAAGKLEGPWSETQREKEKE